MKKKEARPATDVEQYNVRLEEIAETRFGTFSDEEIAVILNERREISDFLEREETRRREEEARFQSLERERSEIEEQLSTLNRSISPDKDDDELLKLIEERRTLEKQLERIRQELRASENIVLEKGAAAQEGDVPSTPETSVLDTEEDNRPSREEKPQENRKEPKEELTEEASPEPIESSETVPSVSLKQDFGEQKIDINQLEESAEMREYLKQLQGNVESLGMLLQGMPDTAKANRVFMLKVAEIDPAYAMHYASDTLRHDEHFNVLVAGMPNRRNSGNALSEMLPEARTAPVVMAGVKQDFRNIRFASPDMEGYREMIDIAKKGALQKLKALKESVDVTLLIPKILQKDKEFMGEAERLVMSGSPKDETDAEPKAKEERSALKTPASTKEERSVWRIHHSEL